MSLKIVPNSFEEAEAKGLTTFKRVLEEVLHRKGLNQFRLAEKLNFSQSYVSLIERGKRPLSLKVATKISACLGGEAATWLEVFEETKAGGSRPLSYYSTLLGIDASHSAHWGARVRQLRGNDLVSFLSKAHHGELIIKKDDVEIDCGIEGFEESHASITSYDIRLKAFAVGRERLDNGELGDWDWIEARESVKIPSGKTVALASKHIQLPDWMEAEINPPSTIALKPLIVSHGPVIDPGWGGMLKVTAYNPSDWDVYVDLNEPFLTLRFWVAESRESLI